LFQ
jgi:hypothetical protein